MTTTITVQETNQRVIVSDGLNTVDSAADTNFSSLADKDIVAYDFASSKFVNYNITNFVHTVTDGGTSVNMLANSDINTIDPTTTGATISGGGDTAAGDENAIESEGNWSSIAGGYGNSCRHVGGTISGGVNHQLESSAVSFATWGINCTYGVIAGGSTNRILAGEYNVIGGGKSNSIYNGQYIGILSGGSHATLGNSDYSVIIGGKNCSSTEAPYSATFGLQSGNVIPGSLCHTAKSNGSGADVLHYQFTVGNITTDAVQTALSVYTTSTYAKLANNSIWCGEMHIAGYEAATGNVCGFHVAFTVKLLGLVPTIVHEVVTAQGNEGVIAGANPSIEVTASQEFKPRVTGSAGKTIEWGGTVKLIQVK